MWGSQKTTVSNLDPLENQPMTNRIPITAEVFKMAQQRCRTTGCDVRQEAARQIAEEAILSLDPELDLLIDEDAAFSRDDRLVSTFDVNDIVVNGVRFDVRLVGEDGRVSIPRYLAGTSYIDGGTLAVSFAGDRNAAVVGYVPRSDWDLQDRHAGAREERLIFRIASQFDLEKQLPAILSAHTPGERKYSRAVHSSDVAQFCGQRQEMRLSEQRDFVEAVLNNEDCWTDLQVGISKPFVRRTLTHASIWNQKLERLAESVHPRFHRLSKEEVKASIARTGERLGGQSDSPQFRKEMLLNLAREELSHVFSGESFARACRLVEQVLSGRAVIDVLKETVKTKTAIDLALAIKQQRQKVTNFIDATSDEISLAFRQLALQPVYATHSGSEQEGVESVNEALKLLDVCELAENLKELGENLD
jgi:hypothetical protein